MISSERMHKPDKLDAIQCGDIVEWRADGQTLRGEVHGWRLSPGHNHMVIVGSTRHEHEVSLRSITARERKKGAGHGTVTF